MLHSILRLKACVDLHAEGHNYCVGTPCLGGTALLLAQWYNYPRQATGMKTWAVPLDVSSEKCNSVAGSSGSVALFDGFSMVLWDRVKFV